MTKAKSDVFKVKRLKPTGLKKHFEKDYMKVSQFDYLYDLVSLSLSSAGMETLSIEEQGIIKGIRPWINVMLLSEFGTFKSTLLKVISNMISIPVYTTVTIPALIGSIDGETKQFIVGAIWDCRRRALLIDEFRTAHNEEMIDCFLQISEEGKYTKRIGRWSPDFKAEDKPFSIAVKNGMIEVKTGMPCIFVSMRQMENSPSYNVHALLSRFIAERWDVDRSHVIESMKGNNHIKLVIVPVEKNVLIGNRDYLAILNYASLDFRDRYGQELQTQIITRAVGDCVRVFAILGFHNWSLYWRILDTKNRIVYMKHDEESQGWKK
jgi:hypothetical protein